MNNKISFNTIFFLSATILRCMDLTHFCFKAESYGGYGCDGQNKMFLNKMGVLNDLKIVGDGLIDTIVVQKDF